MNGQLARKKKQSRRGGETQGSRGFSRGHVSTKRHSRGRLREGNRTKCTGAFYRGHAAWHSETRKMWHYDSRTRRTFFQFAMRYTRANAPRCTLKAVLRAFFFRYNNGHFGNNIARTGLPSRTTHQRHKVKQGNHQRITHIL